MAEVVGIIEEAALLDVQIPDFLDGRIQAHHGQSEGAVVVLNRGIFLRHADDVPGERDVVAQQFDIFIGETDLDAGLVAAGLLRRASGEDADGGGGEACENVLDGAAEAITAGPKKDERRDTPPQSVHGEKKATESESHGRDGMLEANAVP